MAEIFISYAREDREVAARLAKVLEAKGWSTWWDRLIPAGQRFDDVIAERLDGACCVLVLWSKRAVRSAWVVEEAETARARGALVPAMIELVEPPLGFRRIHAADLIGWDGTADHAGFNQLLQDIADVIRRDARSHHRDVPEIGPAHEHEHDLEHITKPRAESDDPDRHDTVPKEGRDVRVVAPGDWIDPSAAVRPPAVAASWDTTTIQVIERRLAQLIGPIAKVVMGRAIQEAGDLPSLSASLGRSIPNDADRRRFVSEINGLRFPKEIEPRPEVAAASVVSASASAASPMTACGLAPAALNLTEIEQALARLIGPIAKVVLKRAVAQSGTPDELCENLMTHIDRTDDRRQFRAAFARWA